MTLYRARNFGLEVIQNCPLNQIHLFLSHKEGDTYVSTAASFLTKGSQPRFIGCITIRMHLLALSQGGPDEFQQWNVCIALVCIGGPRDLWDSMVGFIFFKFSHIRSLGRLLYVVCTHVFCHGWMVSMGHDFVVLMIWRQHCCFADEDMLNSKCV